MISSVLESGGGSGQHTLCYKKRWGSSPVNFGIQGQFALRFGYMSDDDFSEQ